MRCVLAIAAVLALLPVSGRAVPISYEPVSGGAGIATSTIDTAIPEPASLVLVALACCGTIFWKARVPEYYHWVAVGALTFGALTSSVRAGVTYDAAADFSAASNPHGAWSYGWTASLTSEFHLFPTPGTGSGLNSWYDPPITVLGAPAVVHNPTASTITSGTVSILAGQLAFHPGNLGQYSVVRWSAPQSGLTRIAAAFTGRDSWGTTTDVHVLHNGVSLYDGIVNGFATGPAPFETTRAVFEGDTVDFSVGYGNGLFFNDTTSLDGVIDFDAGAYLPGDFNFNGTVDAADYVVWRKNAEGIYTPDDYDTWRAHFGQAQCLCPTFVSHPQSQTVSVGSDVTFFVEVTGTGPLTYQWRKDGADIPGAIDPSFSLLDVVLSDAGDFGVLSVNPCGAAMSDTASLTVILEPLAGDYNHNGVVDAADYVAWRDNLGANIRLPNEDQSQTPGWVTADDYILWQAHFGQTAGAAAGLLGASGSVGADAAIPEPMTRWLPSWAIALLVIRRRFGNDRSTAEE